MVISRQLRKRIYVGVGVTAIAVLGLTAVFFQPLLRIAQDWRQQASSGTGTVLVRATTSSTLAIGQEIVTNIQANTQGTQVDGFQLAFDVTGADISSVALSTPNTNLSVITQQVDRITNGYRVLLAVVPQNVGTAFSSNSYVTVARVRFTPATSGTIQLVFDPSQSISTRFASNPPVDVLRNINIASFFIPAPSVPPTPSPSPSLIPTPSPSPSLAPTPSPSPSIAPTPSPSPSVAPTPSPSPSIQPTPSPTPSVEPTPGATASPIIRRADLNNDGRVDLLDFQIMNQEFFVQLPVLRADINGDGRVDLLDYTVLNQEFSLF